jgi:hypothetical protein
MKKVLLLALLAGSILSSIGCSSPAYTREERYAQIFRNRDYMGKQATDDVDYAALLRPASHLTIWNLR